MKAEQDRRLDAFGAFIAAYEDAHGEITQEEMRAAARRARARAVSRHNEDAPRRGRSAKR